MKEVHAKTQTICILYSLVRPHSSDKSSIRTAQFSSAFSVTASVVSTSSVILLFPHLLSAHFVLLCRLERHTALQHKRFPRFFVVLRILISKELSISELQTFDFKITNVRFLNNIGCVVIAICTLRFCSRIFC